MFSADAWAVRAAAPIEHELERVQGPGGGASLRHGPSGVLFLPWYRGFRVERVHRYDEAGRNVSARYAAGPAALVSVYVFPHSGLAVASDFEATFTTSVRDMLAALSPTQWAHERATAFAHPSGEIVMGRRVEASGVTQGSPALPQQTLVELFVYRRWLVKFRATHQPALRAEVDSFLGAWLAASGLASPLPDALTRRLRAD
ncbi:MAG: hypothetical protein MUF34_37465 [Polyangiaceae bacterium]|jgi:hypothetical protein|nr:hypothetical protein [Polyangiaceae bacterium]